MYNMYKSARIENCLEVAGAASYRNIFTEEYSLSFYHPKRDQCRICMAYNMPGVDKDAMKANYNTHILTKERARAEKKRDSYKWTEVEGKKGSCEIASCLYQYFKSLPADVSHISCFSDSRGGQNINKFVVAMYLTTVQELPNPDNIDLKFMVVGHSEKECDLMHSAITTEQKRVGKVNWPADRKTIVRNDIDGKPVHLQKMCWQHFTKQRPFVMQFKEDFHEEFKALDCNKKQDA
ncbi:hypothetical protein PR048_022512 [Dryococelus australis]|uniref:Uncharacterized protein n=1 Tax=Dryococelus australis TaxID=614101 RepID=A0ABQ9H1A8_9NEOP|nr:hypothetical protein PR048_022512 [Dryococelus australis]